MKIKKIHIEQFKRFTDLTISGIPETAKLVVLVGPNGCGKSSLFDAFKVWHRNKGYNYGTNNDYCKKDLTEQRQSYQLVNINFHNSIADYSREKFRETFYFRTAYRNSPEIKLTSLSKVSSPLEESDGKMMIQNDETVNDNYQRLMSKTISGLYDASNNEKQ